MKQTVNINEFVDSFNGGYKDNFSYDGKVALFDYLEELEEGIGEELELDPIGLCCEYNEYYSLEEFHNDYDKETYPTLEKLEEYTTVIPIGNTDRFIIVVF